MPINKFLYKLTCGSAHGVYSEYDYGKIIVLNSFCILSMATLFVSGLFAVFYDRQPVPACCNFVTLGLIFLIMVNFRLTGNYSFYKASVILLGGVFFIYLVSTGGIENTGPLWTYFFPILSYYTLGHKKATPVILLEIIIYTAILFIPGNPLLTAEYSTYFKVRFIFSTLFVVILSFSLEYARHHAYTQQEMLIKQLKSANDEIKTLSGLIPICSNCKKVKNDKGYWEQVELYLQEKTNVSFTHSICKECADKLYGKEAWYKKM